MTPMTPHPGLTCRDARQLMGVSVLGLTEPAEEEALRHHLDECPECAATLAELSPLPALMATVDAERAASGLPEPRPELLRRILAETRAEADEIDAARRRRRRRLVGVVTACGSAAAATVLAVSLLVGGSGGPQTPTALTASTIDAGSHVRGTFTLTSLDTGSEVAVKLSNATPGEDCRLIVKGTSGQSEVAGWWVVRPNGEATVTGHTSLAADQVSNLVVVTRSGDRILEVPATSLTPQG